MMDPVTRMFAAEGMSRALPAPTLVAPSFAYLSCDPREHKAIPANQPGTWL
jgi:hypothetical protein